MYRGKPIRGVQIRGPARNGYARIRIKDGTEISVPLQTNVPELIAERAAFVRLTEPLVKAGETVTYSWISGNKFSTLGGSIDEYFNKFMKNKATEGLKPKTISAYSEMYSKMEQCITISRRAESLKLADIEHFKQYLVGLKLADATVNGKLKDMKVFTNWLYEHEVIRRKLKVKGIREFEKINYISDKNFELILDHVPVKYRKVFRLYAHTGMRLSEGFLAKLVGTTLLVDPKHSKSKRLRIIELDDYWVEVWKEMRAFGLKPQSFSKIFRKATRAAGLTHKMHDLRHRYGCRTYAITRDILFVSRSMGHSVLASTEKYQKFSLAQLEVDFDLDPIPHF